MIAFSNESDAETTEVVRRLQGLDVQVDIIPRLYELVGPRVDLHTVEGLPLIGLPAARSNVARDEGQADNRPARGSGRADAAFAPVLVHRLEGAAIQPGPIFFRQTRLGMNMRAFTALKFRTMYVDTDDGRAPRVHRADDDASAASATNGIYKLERNDSMTPFGRWLRRTSLDELPQLINVLRGDMSLVGPRPCIPYEIENFAPHHFERFLVPQGLTGLWQVTARAHSTFGEALDMDVAYVRGWSLGLDLRLLCRTPFAAAPASDRE